MNAPANMQGSPGTSPVMVTGATGYVAGWLVKRLLEDGMTVHACVRNPDDSDKLQYLDAVAAEAPGTIRYFRADLLDKGSYDEAMQDSAVVFHTASPFTLTVNDPQTELIEPAVQGTRNVLEAANRTASVRRVVVTSSMAAIYGDIVDIRHTKNGKFTEDDWNTTSSLTHSPYSYSKTLAEREAWRIAEAQDRWTLVTINPSFVVGPGISPFASSGTFEVFRHFGDGTMKMGIPDLYLAAVDVRDVATAHYAAAFTPGAKGRYITSGHNTSLLAMAKILRKHFGNAYPLPRRTLPKALVWLVGPLLDKSLSRTFVSRNVGYPMLCDNSKSIANLGMQYRPLDVSVTELFQQLIDNGLV